MPDTVIKCPNCATQIPVSEVLATQLRATVLADIQKDYEGRIEQARRETAAHMLEKSALELKDLKARVEEQATRARDAEASELEQRRKTRALEGQMIAQETSIRQELEAKLRHEQAKKLEEAVAAAELRARQDSDLEIKTLSEQLAEQREKVRTSQEAELVLRKQKSALEDRAKELDLEVARRLDGAKRQLESELRQSITQEQTLKLKEKEKQIADLRKALEDAKRRSELGSQELQGEVLELDIQAALEQQFPRDRIEPVPKGIRGADILHHILDGRGNDCGCIVWETKNTKHWQPGWLEKLRQDQRAVGASIAVLVSVTAPGQLCGFGQIDGIWVSDLKSWPALAVALREQLVEVAFAHASSEGKSEKIELLYRYLAGDQFRTRVQGIVEAFTSMQQQLARERRSMERLWREREKQIELVMTNTVGMYGEMHGLIGASLPSIPALELESPELLKESKDD